MVDDEEIVLSALCETLRLARYETVATTDPQVALQELGKREFSVIISDQRMPGMSGLELLAQARQLRPNTTRILITAVLSLDTLIDAINQGEIFRFLVKPWLREEFLATVENGVQRYELISQNTGLQASTQSMTGQLAELKRSQEEQGKVIAQQAQRLAELNRLLEGTCARAPDLGLQTLEAFYPPLSHNARNVVELCQCLAGVLNLSPDDRQVLGSSARLYDIGLIRVPRRIVSRWLENPAGLAPDEQALIERHPVLGQELAASGSGLDQVGQVVRAHHERFDGRGYPDRLEGENIPPLARLLAVALAYASSTLPAGEAREAIQLGSGSAFDPDAVRALLRALPQVALPRKELKVTLTDLRPGMVLARGIYTHDGALLLPPGQQLSASTIEKLFNYDRAQPLTQSLLVYG